MSRAPSAGSTGERLLEAVVRRSGWTLAVWVALAAAAAPGCLGLGYDNSPEVYFVRDHAAIESYRHFVESFGDYGALRVVIGGPRLWTRDGLAWLRTIERQARTQAGVVDAAGPWSQRPPTSEAWPPTDPPAFRAELAADPLARNAGWIAADGEVVTLLLALRDLTASERRDLLDRLEALLAERPAGLEARLAGLETVNRALDGALAAILGRLFPLVIALGALATALCLGSLADAALPMLFAAFCQTVFFGLMGYAGVSFNVVTSVLPLLLFVLSLATAAHLLMAAREIERAAASPDPEAVAIGAIGGRGWAVLWTAVTTGVAFGSLAWSRSPPVRSLGLWMAVGIAILLAAAFTLYPALLARAHRPRRRSGRGRFEAAARRLGSAAAVAAIGRRRTVHALFAVLCLVALAGLPRLRVETGVLEYFRPGHPARAAIEDLEAHGVAAVSAELVLRSSPGAFEGPEAAARLRALGERLRALPPALGAVGVADLADGDTPFLRRARSVFLSSDDASTRVTLFVPFGGFTRLEGFFRAAEAAARELVPEAAAAVTGHFQMVLAAQRWLLATMAQSLGITLAIVAVMIALLARGLRLARMALLPNLWPPLLVLGTMGWAGVPLDSATVMIAAVVVGVSVDDTLHFLGGLRRRAELPPAEAARSTLEALAPAHLLTTLVLVLGFGALAASSFVPVARFGALAAWGLVAALAADLLWVPALTAGVDARALERLAGHRPRRR